MTYFNEDREHMTFDEGENQETIEFTFIFDGKNKDI